ncbi:MAG: hypothetical protein HQ518_10875 [Rhodopirellula sp.]|nr:hypothetical protein [Rhodopirellula sp.]
MRSILGLTGTSPSASRVRTLRVTTADLALTGLVLIGGLASCPTTSLAKEPASSRSATPSRIDFGSTTKPTVEIVKGNETATTENTTKASASSPFSRDLTTNSTRSVATTPATVALQTPVDKQPTAAPVKEVQPLPAPVVAHVNQLTGQLVSASRDAWLRGLMDQTSYAAWLDIASTAQLRVAQNQGDRARVLRILNEQVALWTEAAEELEAFNQPAARGWQADLSHSQVMAMRATLRYSMAVGQPLSANDQQAYAELATQHLNYRIQEFQFGTGSAADVLSAARMVDEQIVMPDDSGAGKATSSSVAIATFQVQSPVALRRAIDEVERPVHLAGFPRSISIRDFAEDRAAIRSVSAFANFLDTPTADRKSGQFLGQLDQNSSEIAERQFAGFQTGTATPGGMLRDWWLQESMTESVAKDLPGSAFNVAQTQRLQQIHQLAMSLQDLRGRNSADVAAAETLFALRQLDLAPSSGQQQATRQQQAGQTSEKQATPEALVVEYSKKSATDGDQ